MGGNSSIVEYHKRRLTDLQALRSPWEAHWRDLADNIAPDRLRFVSEKNKGGQKNRRKIVDSAPGQSLRTLGSGMHSGITSPARPWFRLAAFDENLKEHAGSKEWMATIERRMREVFAASNLYPSYRSGYSDLGLFGQFAGLLVEDDRRVIRLLAAMHGSFFIARNDNGEADTLYRQMWKSVEQLVARFGYDRCPRVVQQCYDNGKYSERFLLNHAVEPRHQRDERKIDRANKPFLSNYWLDEAGNNLLEESGFDANPIIAPAWERMADDDYAMSPAMDALPDVKQLHKMQLMKGEAIEKQVRPPMQGPTSLENNPASLMPGAITFVDDPAGKGFRPAMEVRLSLADLNASIREVRDSVDRAFYADLFLMLAQMEGIQPRNQFEIAERKEEKLLALGPVLENIYAAQLRPTIDRTFEIMDRRGMIPPAPPELEGQELRIEYISILAQAQKAVSTGSIERLLAFVGNVAGVNPGALDKIDADQAIDEYADLIGTPPSIVVADERVEKIRSERAEQQRQKDAAEQAAQMAPALRDGAEAARLLSETDQGGGNILQQIGLQ